MKIELNLKDIIVFVLIIVLFVLYVSLWTQLKVANQVAANTESIRQIVTFLNQAQQRPQPPALGQPPQQEEKKK